MGELEVEQTKERLQVVMYGTEQSADLETRAQACISSLEEFRRTHEAAEHVFDELTAELHAISPSIDQDRIPKMIEMAKKGRKGTAKAMSRVEAKHSSFEARAALFSSAAARPNLQSLRDGLKNQVKAAEAKNKEIGERLEVLENMAATRRR